MPNFFIYKDQIKFRHFPHHIIIYHFRMRVVFSLCVYCLCFCIQIVSSLRKQMFWLGTFI